MRGKAFREPIFHGAVEGKITQFSEIMKPQPTSIFYGTPIMKYKNQIGIKDIQPCYQVGEVLYIKEPYYMPINIFGQEIDNGQIIYKFDEELNESKSSWVLKNKLFMPAKYARYFIEITGVRCERLQDISDEDCLKEGIKKDKTFPDNTTIFLNGLQGFINSKGEKYYDTPQQAYAALIDKINGKGTWERNDDIWVYDFKLTDKK